MRRITFRVQKYKRIFKNCDQVIENCTIFQQSQNDWLFLQRNLSTTKVFVDGQCDNLSPKA